jgi:hypothetical protein
VGEGAVGAGLVCEGSGRGAAACDGSALVDWGEPVELAPGEQAVATTSKAKAVLIEGA